MSMNFSSQEKENVNQSLGLKKDVKQSNIQQPKTGNNLLKKQQGGKCHSNE